MANLYESLPANLNNGAPPPPPPQSLAPPAPAATPPKGPKQQQKKNNPGRGGLPLARGNKKYAPGGGPRGAPPMQNEPRKAAAMGGAAGGGIKASTPEQKSGKSEMKSGPLQPSTQQKSDVSHHFAGMDREYHEEQTDDPAMDMANDMEQNDIYAIRVNRERQNRKKREKIACLTIIILVSIGVMLTITSGILLALDLSKNTNDDGK